MLRNVKAVWRCDSCDKEEETLYLDSFKTYRTLEDLKITSLIIYGDCPIGWVRDREQNHWCSDCHEKRKTHFLKTLVS